MQIVINITNELHVRLMEMGDMDCGTFNESVLVEVIKNGTPLPKGHGRLIDGDACYSELKKEIPNVDIDCSLRPYEEGIYSAMMEIKDTPTIIDKED